MSKFPERDILYGRFHIRLFHVYSPSVWCSGVLGGEVERDGGLRSKGGQTQPGYANGAQWYIRAPSSAA